MVEIVKLADLEAISQEAAKRWLHIATQAATERGKFRIALSGGKTPQRLYEIMASSPFHEQAPWSQTYVFWGDERRVAPSHPESDYRMARESLLDHVPIPPEQIIRMQGDSLASTAVRDYETRLRQNFAIGSGEWPTFDLVLLGLGADGHTASIFPGTRAVSDLTNMVVVYEVPQLKVERMTLTRPVFNHARNILFLVSGSDKAAALASTLNSPHQPTYHPAQGIEPVQGTLTWLVDQAAASQLKSRKT